MKYATADFETTTDSKKPLKVWAWGLCDIDNPESCFFGEKISDFFKTCLKQGNLIVYFHNLRFDGGFVLDWLFKNGFTWILDKRQARSKTFTTIISDDGKFYAIEIWFEKQGKHTKKISLYDSLKLMNFDIATVAKSFGLHLKKGSIDYDRHNQECEITNEEWEYLKNDVQIAAYAMQQLRNQDFTKMTIGACALNDYKKSVGDWFKHNFPVLTYETDSKIRCAYKGGYTYCNPENQLQDLGGGLVLDVNSLYPYVMQSKPLPYGVPLEFQGQYQQCDDYPLFIQKLECQFELKENHLPTIQLKHSMYFAETEYLKSSVNSDGILQMIDLTLTNVDLDLFFEHYHVYNITYKGGYMFKSSTKLFTDWVDKWAAVKIKADKEKNKGLRTIAKLMLNNLYGKFSLNPQVKSKYPVYNQDKKLVEYDFILYTVTDENGNIVLDEMGNPRQTPIKIRDGIYIPVGAFITAYAREITIRTSQKIHYDSIIKTGHSRYCYSDTDSIHLLGFDIPEGVDIHPTRFGAWKLENYFERARFIRAKRYIEDIILQYDNGNFIKNAYGDLQTQLKITCAGMPKSCYKFVTWENFKVGAVFDGKLIPKTLDGGVCLIPTEFTLKG